jgi:FtsH-binding integral membrane protein
MSQEALLKEGEEVSAYEKFTADGYEKGGSSALKDRIGFIQKVYGILLCMLGLTAVIIGASLKVDSLRGCEYGAGTEAYDYVCDDEDAVYTEKGLIGKIWVPAAIGAVISLLILYFVPIGADGKPIHMVVPYNYTLTLIFTVCCSVAYSKISLAAQAGSPGVVLEAFVLTAAAVLGITIFAFTGFRKLDGVDKISFIGPGLSAIGLLFGVASIFVFAPNDLLGCDRDEETNECKPSGIKLLYAVLGVSLFAMIMLFDTASVIGGKSMMFELGPETYILGAIQLYLEIINMFVLAMVILGDS